MTDQSEEKGPKLPPRINLNLDENKAPSAPSEGTGGTQPPPPKAKITPRPAAAQRDSGPSEGGKIKLNLDETLKEVEKQVAPTASQPEPARSAEKPKIKLNFSEAALEDTPSPVEPPAAETPQKPTAPPPAAASEKPKIKLNVSGVDTPPASEPKAAPPAPNASEENASKSVPASPEQKEAPAQPKLTLKTKPESAGPDAEPASKADAEIESSATPESSSKAAIQLDDIDGESLDELYQAALNATQRVILDEKEKAATNRIDTDESQALKKAELAEASKKSTARLDLEEMLSDDERQEIMKHETMHIRADGSTPEAPKPSGTMKIKRPDTPPPEAASDSTMAIPLDLEESKKSETARIELPREVASNKPASGRKTIRIKRPDGSGAAARPALNIARSSAPAESAPTSAETAAKAAISFDTDDSDVDSPAFAAVALVAVLVGLALVYVLVATMIPGLPFPGRLV